MYRITKTDGTVIGVVEKVNYIKIGESGSYTPTKREEAIGVAYKSVPYNLVGHNDIEGIDTVVITEIDGGQVIADLEEQLAAAKILLGLED